MKTKNQILRDYFELAAVRDNIFNLYELTNNEIYRNKLEKIIEELVAMENEHSVIVDVLKIIGD